MNEHLPSPDEFKMEFKGNPTEDERDAVIAAIIVSMGATAAREAEEASAETAARRARWSPVNRTRAEVLFRRLGQHASLFRRGR